MKILHIPFVYFPDPCGGTEVYVAALARHLDGQGVESVIAAPALTSARYDHEGHRVHRFAIEPKPTLEMLYGQGDNLAAATLGLVLDEERPSVVHFHAFSPGVSARCLEQCQSRGLPTVFTYHTPTASCSRGSLMRWGTEPCDGKLRVTTCAACLLHSHGMPKPMAWLAAFTSPIARFLAPLLPRAARWQLPTRAKALMALWQANVHQWFNGMDRIIALCAWTEKLLRINGADETKVRKIRHGLTQAISPEDTGNLPVAGRAPALRLVFLGRLDPAKGLHLVLDALKSLPDSEIKLDVYTVVETSPSIYAVQMLSRLAQEPRIKICRPVTPDQVVATLKNYDALLVPSQWSETGPLVVLEAFAAGIPVIGSNLGGISEWVTDEKDGLLVSATTPEAWATAILRLTKDPTLLPRLRTGITPPRSMQEVTLAVLSIYREIFATPPIRVIHPTPSNPSTDRRPNR